MLNLNLADVDLGTGLLLIWDGKGNKPRIAFLVRKSIKAKGFQVLARRWVLERTFGWLGRYRRLPRDYEHATASSEAWSTSLASDAYSEWSQFDFRNTL